MIKLIDKTGNKIECVKYITCKLDSLKNMNIISN